MRRISGTSHRVVTQRTPLGHMAEGGSLGLVGRSDLVGGAIRPN